MILLFKEIIIFSFEMMILDETYQLCYLFNKNNILLMNKSKIYALLKKYFLFIA